MSLVQFLVLDEADRMLDMGYKITLETSGKDVKIHSKRVGKMLNYTRKECV
jgi:superfamily II DNA/RNA helicase